MLNVLIADDEPMICELIAKLVDWDGLGMRCTAKVHDGCAAAQILQREPVDIVITDIQMPGMDGLELIARAQQLGHRPRFVVVSGYREFEYARRALRYGVEEYLLKPVRKSDLNLILQKLMQQWQAEHAAQLEQQNMLGELEQRTRTLRRRELQQLLEDGCHLPDPALFSFSNSADGWFGWIAARADLLYSGDIAAQAWRTILENTIARLHQSLSVSCRECEWVSSRAEAYLLLHGTGSKPDCLPAIQKIMQQLSVQYEHARLTLAVGKIVGQAEALPDALSTARRTMQARLVFGTGGVLQYAQYERLPEGTPPAISDDLRQKLRHALEAMNGEQTELVLKAWYRLLPPRRDKQVCTLYDRTRELALWFEQTVRALAQNRQTVQVELPIEIWDGLYNCADASALCDWICAFVRERVEQWAEQYRAQESEPVRLAKQYVAKHIDCQISLEEAAAQSYISAGYFSTLFREKAGETFSDYVIRMRIETAKEYLREGRYTVAEVARRVGYADARHFSKTFRKLVGIKPTLYRQFYA